MDKEDKISKILKKDNKFMEDYYKVLKTNKVTLITAVIFILVGALGIFGIEYILPKFGEKTQQELIGKDYRKLISSEQDIENEYVEVTITYIPYIFMQEEDNGYISKYYFVVDQYNYPYIVRLTDSTYEILKSKYNENSKDFSYTLKGYIFEYSAELKGLTIEAYNQAIQKELVSEENFKFYFGKTYLDETLTPFNIAEEILLIVVCICVGVGCAAPISLIAYVVAIFKTRRTLKIYNKEELEYELSKSSTLEYEKVKVYLTDKFIISKSILGLNVLEYNDIVWVYYEKRSVNFIPIGTWLVAFNNKRVYDLACRLPFKKDIQQFKEIILKIEEKNPDVMINYTKENQEKYNKEIHNKI